MEYASKSALRTLRTRVTKAITKDYYVTPGYVHKAMYMQLGYQTGRLLIRSRRSSLKSYKLSPKNAPRKRKLPGYVSGAVRRDSGMTRFNKGFILDLDHNDLPVIRIGKGVHGSFEGMKVLTGPSISQLAEWSTERNIDEIRAAVNREWLRTIKYWTNAALSGKWTGPSYRMGFDPERKRIQLGNYDKWL